MILAAQDTNPIPYPLEGPVSDYSAHIQQFDAFQKGQICLDLPVDPRLATMENPYDTSARNALGVSYHWDRAFFGGRYYSYFGVVPVLLALLSLLLDNRQPARQRHDLRLLRPAGGGVSLRLGARAGAPFRAAGEPAPAPHRPARRRGCQHPLWAAGLCRYVFHPCDGGNLLPDAGAVFVAAGLPVPSRRAPSGAARGGWGRLRP